jgi:serine/threonine-protein kinase
MSGSGEFNAQPLEVKYTGSSTETPALGSSPDAVRCPKCGMDVPRIARNCPNDGTDLLIRQGQVFADKYELLDVVGSGAMGIIYKARHLILDKIVAIKVLHTNTADTNLIMRFQREAKAASSLNHINVITVYDFGVHCESAPYMVMDYLQGQTLAEFIEERGQVSLRETLDIAEQILSALAHAQKKNILHRDLKPGNIMILEEEGEPRLVKILDFGLAKLLDRDDQVPLSAVGSALGSPAYMSPEQATGLKVDARSDLYSLGCMMYEMIAGQTPLLGESPMETLVNRLNKRVPPLRETIMLTKRSRSYNPLQEIPTIVELFVAKLLERDQRDRFQTAQDARNYLNTIWEYVDPVEASEISIRAAKKTTTASKPARAPEPASASKPASSPKPVQPNSRVTVKDIAVSDIAREAQAHNSARSETSSDALPSVTDSKPAQSGFKSTISSTDIEQLHLQARSERSTTSSQELPAVGVPRTHRRSHNGLRKIVSEKQQQSSPIPAKPNSGQIQFQPDLWYAELERFAHRLIDLTHSFQRSSPELYRVALALAFIALIVVVLILR